MSDQNRKLEPRSIEIPMAEMPRECLWGAPRIARFCGVSIDTVHRWARLPNVPVFKPKGATYFAVRSELARWMRSKPDPS